MGIELARAYVSVRGDASQLPADLSNVKNMIEEALGDARTYAAGFLAKFASLSSGFLQMGAAVVARNEQTFTSFETMIGSAEETKRLLADITQFAAVTPFEMPQLLQVAQELLTFGERGTELMDTLKLLGDASGGTAAKFGILGIVFNQVRGVGKLLTQDFRQLSTRGILFLKDIQKYFKLETEQQAQDFLSSGKVSFEDLRGILKMLTGEGERFYNSMIRQSTTLIGLQSTYNDAWNILASKMAEVSAPLDKLILQLKIRLVGALDSVTTASKGMVGGMLQGATAAAKLGAVVLAGQVVMRLFGATLRTALIGTGIGAAILAIGAAVGGLVALFSQSKAGLRAWGEVSKDFQKIWINIKEAFIEFGKSVSEAFENAFGVSFTEVLVYASERVADFIIGLSRRLVQISEMVRFTMDAVSFIFRNGWSLISIASIDFTLQMIDGIQQIQIGWRSFAQWMGQVLSGIGAMLTSIGGNTLAKFLSIKDKIVAELAAAWAGIQAVWNREDPFAAMDAAYAASMERVKNRTADLKDPLAEFKAAFEAAQKPIDTGNLIGADLEQGLREQKKLLQEQIDARERERERRREERAAEKVEEEKKAEQKKKEDSILKTGRYGFEQFGTALQDAILKGAAGDKQGQMVSLLENGNKIQADQLDEMKKNNPGGLGP